MTQYPVVCRYLATALAASLAGACAASPPRPMQLRKVILYQNGIGYFERGGHLTGQRLMLRFAKPELDDVLKTLTVIDRLGGSVATVDVPTTSDKARTIELGVRLGAVRTHDLLVGYAVPTPTWKAAYRIVLDDRPEASLLQGWAMVNNATQEDWKDVSLTLATGAPMSFAGDLSTVQYVKRPDASGHLIAPTVLGPIDGEQANPSQVDHDGDGILDVDDKCPTDVEDANGYDDDDGCPDRGRVIISENSITILQTITFTRGADAVDRSMLAIVDAVAAALRGNPDIARIEIGGHASADEAEPWGLSSRRAAAVQEALIARGIAPERLVIAPYGSTQLLDVAGTDSGHLRNRRVEFLILQRGQGTDEAAAVRPVMTTATMAASVRARAKPSAVAGAVRYALSEPVSIKRGASSMVSILNKPVLGEDVFLYRPDGNGPGSDRHPFRAVRFVNKTGFTLEPGPIAIFGRGTFVGDTLLARLDVDETAWIPYALDGGTSVSVATAANEKPVRLVTIQRGVITVENTATRMTRYTVAAGRETARTLYVRHAKAAGYAARDLPPLAIDQGDAYLVPLPLTAARTSVLAIEEHQPLRRTISLTGSGPLELAAYLEGAPADVAARLRGVMAIRKDIGILEEEIAALRIRVGDVAHRAGELRRSIKALERVRADDLRKRLVTSLT
ncbi:MAG: OmpA family protein, partial [Myxococcota bacterium]|nr:OmpA family protein [Myxococcota bacterium]